MDWHRACRAEDVAEGAARVFEAGGRKVLVVRSGGHVYAADPRCPHLGLSLENGEVAEGTVRCRAHGYRMELSSGRCLTERGLTLEVHRAELRDGWVWVSFA